MTEAVSDLTRIKSLSDEFDNHWNTLCDVLQASPESPLFEVHARLLTECLDQWSHRYGIHPDATAWFVNEARWGESKSNGVYHGAVMIPMDSIESFVAYELGQLDPEKSYIIDNAQKSQDQTKTWNQ
jgi:hypothetical protein